MVISDNLNKKIKIIKAATTNHKLNLKKEKVHKVQYQVPRRILWDNHQGK